MASDALLPSLLRHLIGLLIHPRIEGCAFGREQQLIN
jgi:hypothetical protein